MQSDARPSRVPPWATAFEPAANLDALGAIRRRGLAAAQALVERFVDTTDEAREDPEPSADRPDDVAALWRDAAAVTLRALGAPRGGDGDDLRSRLVLDAGRGGALPLVFRPADRSVDGVLWMHNTTESDATALRPHCAGLWGTDGARFAAELTFVPPIVDLLPAGSSAAVRVHLQATAEDAAPGVRRGIVLVDGLPDVWLVLDVMVT